jgi:hypothetical protein
MAALTVMIIVQLWPGSPSVFWVEAGTSCANFFAWRARADAYAQRNRLAAPHGSCFISYALDDAYVYRHAQELAVPQLFYLQVPEMLGSAKLPDYVK